VVVGLVQLQLPVVETPGGAGRADQRICDLVAKARRNQGTMDLVVFPEYALHGLSMAPTRLMCSLDGPEVAAFKAACVDNNIWGCFSIMEHNPAGNPYNSGLIIDDTGRGQAVLPQAAPLGAGGALGARQPGRAGVRRAQRQQARH
jgi:formamidase